jgi:hypothetical protein
MDVTTVDQFAGLLPPKVLKVFGQEVIDRINQKLNDPDMHEVYRDNLLGYTSVLSDGKFKLPQYVDAVKFCSHRLCGQSQLEAYTRTFPDRMARFAAKGTSDKDISSYVYAFNNTKLVKLIMEQAAMPTWLGNMDLFNDALRVQSELMRTAQSEKVRSDAANSILTHLKRPDIAKIELDVAVKEDSAIAALRDTTEKLIAQQRQSIGSGMMNAQEVAHSTLTIEGEVIHE